jgi:hypothetical protein
MEENPNNKEIQDKQSDEQKIKIVNTLVTPGNKTLGQDDDENLKSKTVKQTHEYINPTAEEEGTIEDERSGIKASGNSDDDKNPGDDRNPETDQKTDEVNMNRERNDQNINHDRKVVDATDINVPENNNPNTDNN